MWISLLAQATPTVDMPTGGWAGIGSMFGVLSWLLLWYIPGKDKASTKLLEDLRSDHKAMMDLMRADHKDTIARFTQEIGSLRDTITQNLRPRR